MGRSAYLHRAVVFGFTGLTFLLALAGFVLAGRVRDPGLWLLSLVIAGTGYDFIGSNFGLLTKNDTALRFIARTRFSLLNFGIIFTPFSAAFILQHGFAPTLSTALAEHYLPFLVFSLVTGAMFLGARYQRVDEEGVPICLLDKSDRYTRVAFVVRRAVLACSLVIALVTIFEGLQTGLAGWTILYGGLFIATVPLHILHRELLSMAAELATLVVLFYGAARVYGAL